MTDVPGLEALPFLLQKEDELIFPTEELLNVNIDIVEQPREVNIRASLDLN